MKKIVYIVAVLLVTSCIGGKDLTYDKISQGDTLTDASTAQLDHSKWDGLLKKYVDDKGFVNYNAFNKEHDVLKEYLSYLNVNSPQKNWAIQEQFAYYINLYNAATVDLILENDMPASIKDIDGPLGQVWLKKYIMVNDEEYSLAGIEKNVLQKMGDPRIHFAINCASYSCPKLQNTAFTALNVNSLMDRSAREFVNSDKNDLSDTSAPKLSSIFKFYPEDFTTDTVTIVDYVNKYATTPLDDNASVSYKEYDWSLNKQ